MANRLLAPGVALMACLIGCATAQAADSCKLTALAQLPVTMQGTRPMIPAKINGTDVKFLLDSGAFYSILSPASAAALDLPTVNPPANLVISGVGGDNYAKLATVRDFGLAGAVVNNMEFLVAGGSYGDAVGVLGQNILSFADMEYDLGGGTIRLIRAEKCKDAAMVYWIKPGEEFSSVPIDAVSRLAPHIRTTATLNGRKIRVLMDTGAAYSLLTLRAAERAGIEPTSPGVVEAGRIRGGGARVIPTWIAPFQSFRIGAEEIRDTRIRIGDIELRDADMLLGADFFLSHRIYVSHAGNKVLFTYRGGPVFDLGRSGGAESIDAPGEAVADLREPVDAQGYARRGAVYAARRDLPRALADLARAIELAPAQADYYYQRGMLHQQSRQSPAALSDMHKVIELDPGHVPGRVARAGLLLSRLQSTGAGRIEDVKLDIDAARAATSPEADTHFELGHLYANVGEQEHSLASFLTWLRFHRDDSRAAEARAMSCRARALLNEDLDQALDDCNSAARDRPESPQVLEARGLAHLRLGNFDRAISDYDKVLAEQPRNAWALYGRGLAKLRKGQASEGQADIAAARAANPRTVQNAVTRGLVP